MQTHSCTIDDMLIRLTAAACTGDLSERAQQAAAGLGLVQGG